MRPGNKNFSGLDLQEADFSSLDLSDAVFSDSNLKSANFEVSDLSNADFSGANLSNTTFRDANLENVDFRDVRALNIDLSQNDLTTVDLSHGNFTLGEFEYSDLNGKSIFGINLYNANLENARMGNCEFVDPSLVDSNLSGADLRQTTFYKADIRGINIEDAQLSGSTEFKRFSWEPKGARSWDTLAKSYERVRQEFKKNALNTSQKSLYFLQRRARTVESFSERRPFSFIIGGASELLTGYGVRVRYPLVWTILLMALSTLWYSYVPDSTWAGGPLHYSIATFVTSAPHPPDSLQSELLNNVTQLVVLTETYFGTVLIILLGYVLGNRDTF